MKLKNGINVVDSKRLIDLMIENRLSVGRPGQMIIHFDGAGKVRRIDEITTFNLSGK